METDLIRGGPAEPRLVTSRCRRCALVAFPPERYGCERCGTVRSHAVVHRHHQPEPATPFTVVEVALDAGPVLKAVLAGTAMPPRGARVVGLVQGERSVFQRASEEN